MMKKATKNEAFRENYHFVTGRLAEYSLRQIVESLSSNIGFAYTVGVMPITVAALITSRWLKRHLTVPEGTTCVVVPGYCNGFLDEIKSWVDVPVQCGPKDLRDLPNFFSLSSQKNSLEDYSIEIIAEINHAPNHSIQHIAEQAIRLSAEGADVIDLGCNPDSNWNEIENAVAALREQELRVSVDTFNPQEARRACDAGAELVLSVNSNNRQFAQDWQSEVVVIPDTPNDLDSMDQTIDFLQSRGTKFRIDPILEPIGFGFSQSIQRYIESRRRYPEIPMMMGIGNLSELSDVDSAGINFLLLGLCQELNIQSVLTTQVINWARSSVKECDIARRILHHSVSQQSPPKHISEQLVMLRDARVNRFGEGALQKLSEQIRDKNYRIFAQDDLLHLVSANLHLQHPDPFQLFANLLEHPEHKSIDSGHAFYLGYEFAKAVTALTLDKNYEQDEALRWGHLTREEKHHRLERKGSGKPRTDTGLD